jgi:D-sedoheptulose 7-phosphate isomerase
MNNLEKMYLKHRDVASFSGAYFAYVAELMRALDPRDISAFMQALEDARVGGHTIFIVGNGGSASTASHMGTDFGMAVRKVGNLSEQFRALPLTDHVSIMTAAANDYGYEHIFTKQLEIQYRAGDVLIAISGSGNSPNVVRAAEWVRERGGKVLGLLGFDGGQLERLCDICIVVRTPKGEYGPVEDIHLVLNHMFTAWMHLTFGKHEARERLESPSHELYAL